MGTIRIFLLLLPFVLWANLPPVGQFPLRGDDQRHAIVTGATNATPVQLTFNRDPQFVVGDVIQCVGVAGNLAANGVFKVKTVGAGGSVTITNLSDVDVAGTGAFSNGDTAEDFGGYKICGKVTLRDLVTAGGSRKLLLSALAVTHAFANVHDNGYLINIVVAGNTATANYSRAHGLTTSHFVCVYGASDPDLNCAMPNGGYAITSVPTTTSLTFTVANVTAATYSIGNSPKLTISAWGTSQNPNWQFMWAARNLMVNTFCPGGDCRRAEDYDKRRASATAEICYMNPADTAACAAVKDSLLKAETVAQNFHCETDVGNLGAANCRTGLGDFASFAAMNLAVMYEVLRADLTSGERTAFANKMLNAVLGSETCTLVPRQTAAGTISFTAGAAVTATGTGLGALQVGDVLFSVPSPQHVGTESFAYVDQISPNVVVSAKFSHSGGIYFARPPTSTNCGLIYFLLHHPGTFGGNPSEQQDRGGTTSGGGVTPFNNMTLSKIHGILAIALVLCQDDARACFHGGAQSQFFLDYARPNIDRFWAGLTHSGSNYNYSRMVTHDQDIRLFLKHSVQSAPDLTTAPHIEGAASPTRFIWAPQPELVAADKLTSYAFWPFGADGSTTAFAATSGFQYGWGQTVAALPYDNTEARKHVHWLRTRLGYQGESLTANDYWWRVPATILPLDYVADANEPKQIILRSTSPSSACTSSFQFECDPESSAGYAIIMAVRGFLESTRLAIDFGGYKLGDHAAQTGTGNWWLNHKGRPLIWSDYSRNGGPAQGFVDHGKVSLAEIGGARLARGLYFMPRGIPGTNGIERSYTTIPGWAGPTKYGRADSKFMGVHGNVANHWWLLDDGFPTDVTQHERRFLWLPSGSTTLVAAWERIAISASNTIRSYVQYAQNGQGADGGGVYAAEGATTLNSGARSVASDGVSVQLRSQFFFPAGGHIEGAAAPGGNTYRVTVCAGSGSCGNATTFEFVQVHLVDEAASPTFTPTELNPNSNWTGFAGSGWTALFARGTAASVPAVSHPGGNYLVAGLPAGTYDVLRDSAPVCSNVVVPAGDGHLFCESVAAGSVSVQVAGGGGGTGSVGLGGAIRVGGTAVIK